MIISRHELAVVVPAYNEAATVASVVSALLEFCERVVVVDDGSTDSTASAVAALPVELIEHGRNLGKGAALRTGLAAVEAERPRWVATIDADGQHDPETVVRLLARARQVPDALIIAERQAKKSEAPASRRLANGIADFFISWASRRCLPDTQSGFRLYPGAPLFQLLAGRRRWSGGFAWEAEALIEMCRQGVAVETIPIRAVYQGQLRASHYRPWKDSTHITLLVGSKILARGLDPVGFLRSVSGK